MKKVEMQAKVQNEIIKLLRNHWDIIQPTGEDTIYMSGLRKWFLLAEDIAPEILDPLYEAYHDYLVSCGFGAGKYARNGSWKIHAWNRFVNHAKGASLVSQIAIGQKRVHAGYGQTRFGLNTRYVIHKPKY